LQVPLEIKKQTTVGIYPIYSGTLSLVAAFPQKMGQAVKNIFDNEDIKKEIYEFIEKDMKLLNDSCNKFTAIIPTDRFY